MVVCLNVQLFLNLLGRNDGRSSDQSKERNKDSCHENRENVGGKKKAGPQVHHVNYPTILTFSIVALSKVYVRWVHLLCFTFRNQNDKVRLPVNEKGA